MSNLLPPVEAGRANLLAAIMGSTALTPAGPAPVNTVLPVISGTVEVGQTLTVSNGTWDNSPTSFTYQWYRGGVAISGATNNTYVLVSADDGPVITARVTAHNGGGSTTAESAGVTTNPFTGYALAFQPTTDDYWVSGTQYGDEEGPELYTGGDWSNGTTGFTTTGTPTVAGGTVTLDQSEEIGRGFATVIGAEYQVTIASFAGNTGNSLIRIGNSFGGFDHLNAGMGSLGPYTFVATATTSWVTLMVGNPGPAITGQWGAISVKEQPGPWALPGYTFTRSGEQGAIDSTGLVEWFPANVPAINDEGYHAYGALTNTETYSTAFGSRSLFNATVTADNFVAPDGTTTGDLIVSTSGGGQSAAYVTPAYTAAVYTTSVFVSKTAGTATYGYLQLNTSTNIGANINKTTGAVSNNDLTAPTAKYVIDCGSHWRFVIVYTATVASGGNYYGPSDSATARNSATGSSIGMWGAQTLLGNFPDGGPIIRTAGATASIGASNLATTANTITSDQDFIMWAVAELGPVTGTNQNLMVLGTDLSLYRDGAGSLNGFYGGVIASGKTLAGAGRAAILMRRTGGNWTVFAKAAGGVAGNSALAAGAFPATTTTLNIGHNAGVNRMEGAFEGGYTESGTFSDAECNAILDAAVA